jgi:hypothetical protein
MNDELIVKWLKTSGTEDQALCIKGGGGRGGGGGEQGLDVSNNHVTGKIKSLKILMSTQTQCSYHSSISCQLQVCHMAVNKPLYMTY